MARPILYVFAISHFCEKARWALDYLDIDYDITDLAPGQHASVAKKLGAKNSRLPVLLVDGKTIQGSAEIVTWAEGNSSTDAKSLTPGAAAQGADELERRLDDVLGVHIRRMFYSEALVDYPQEVRPMFTRNLKFPQKIMLRAAWPVICKKMILLMDLGPEQGRESRRIVEAELDWFDRMIADAGQFLIGGGFSWADIAAASLLAPLVLPKEHPTYGDVHAPPRFARDMEQWITRPSLNWVRDIYAEYR